MIRLLRAGAATLGLVTLFLGVLLGWNLWSYQRLTAEQLVADIGFIQSTQGAYLATLTLPDGSAQQFTLKGDDWQLDARLVTWAPWMQLLGNDPLFRLDRLSGRYRDIEEVRTQLPTAYALAENPGLDLWALARDGGDWLPGIDGAYGSAVFLPMTNGARYRITLSARGLVARPYNESAAAAVSTWY